MTYDVHIYGVPNSHKTFSCLESVVEFFEGTGHMIGANRKILEVTVENLLEEMEEKLEYIGDAEAEVYVQNGEEEWDIYIVKEKE